MAVGCTCAVPTPTVGVHPLLTRETAETTEAPVGQASVTETSATTTKITREPAAITTSGRVGTCTLLPPTEVIATAGGPITRARVTRTRTMSRARTGPSVGIHTVVDLQAVMMRSPAIIPQVQGGGTWTTGLAAREATSGRHPVSETISTPAMIMITGAITAGMTTTEDCPLATETKRATGVGLLR